MRASRETLGEEIANHLPLEYLSLGLKRLLSSDVHTTASQKLSGCLFPSWILFLTLNKM